MTLKSGALPRLATAALIILLSVSVFVAAGCRKKEKGLEGSAPDFTLSDLNGNPVSLSSFKGKPVLVEFWATWCPPCRVSLPEVNALYERYKGRGFVVLAVSLDQSITEARDFAKQNGLTVSVLFDDRGIDNLYHVTGIPTAFLLDKQGIIKQTHSGFGPRTMEELSSEIEKLL